jgi:predicted ester cyclase
VDLIGFYAEYLATCNIHDFVGLDAFVAADVVVNGEPVGLDTYVAGLLAVVDAFPDYRWELRHLLADGDVIAAHFADSGTHRGVYLGVPPTGRLVRTDEFAFYRVADGRIAEVWVTADNERVRAQLAGPST